VSSPILTSTLFLTLLLVVGLFFFIRASVKERTETLTLVSRLSEENLSSQLEKYLTARAYRLKTVNNENSQMVFEGFVRPSWFLAILLSVLAVLGLLSLSLVIYFLYPSIGFFSLFAPLFAPLAGLFYWKNAGRQEQVLLNLKPMGSDQTQIEIIAHRDELIAVQKSLQL